MKSKVALAKGIGTLQDHHEKFDVAPLTDLRNLLELLVLATLLGVR